MAILADAMFSEGRQFTRESAQLLKQPWISLKSNRYIAIAARRKSIQNHEDVYTPGVGLCFLRPECSEEI
jgi:DTW domain-containing protein YfiP